MMCKRGSHSFVPSFIVAENEEFDRFGALLEHFYGFSKKNPSSRIRTYQNQFYRNLVKHEFSEPGALVWKAPASLWSLNFVEGVPQFTMEMVDIVGLNGGDSTMVVGVNGVFYPQEGVLKAKGGTIIWSREGQLEKEVYAELGSGHLKRIRRILKPIALHFMPMNSMTSRYKVFWKSAFRR